MKEIMIHHPYKEENIPKEDVVLVLGFFDGVHIGHQDVIEKGREMANKTGRKLALLTFNHHPSIVFDKLNFETLKSLASDEKKKELMEELGVDVYYVVDFTSKFAHLTPTEFVDQYIVGLHAKVVVAGFDYTFGDKGVGTIQNLPDFANGRFEVVQVEEYALGGEKVSSTKIRQMLDEGEMEKVNNLLGYTYEITGLVVHGEARGRTIGFPTANIEISPSIRLPKVGVYVNRVKVNDKWYRGMASIGYNDTFGDNLDLTLEVYILDFNEDIYGETITVEWHHYIRGMVKFNGIDALIEQLQSDEAFTRAYEF